MTTTTSNYGLFKYVSSSDGNLAFNITSALNNNWDKLDTYAVRRSTTAAVGSTGQPVYINSSGVVTAATAYSSLPTGLTATVSLSENGYIKFSNYLLIQWGIISSTDSVTLNISYADNKYNIAVSNDYASNTYVGDTIKANSLSTTGFVILGAKTANLKSRWLTHGTWS